CNPLVLAVLEFGVGMMLKATSHRCCRWLAGLPRHPKRGILATADFLLLSFALWLTLSLRLGVMYLPPSWPVFFVLLAAPTLGVATFFRLGLYRLVTRFIGAQSVLLIAVAVGLSGLVWATLVLLSGVQSSLASAAPALAVQVVPRSVIVIYPIVAAALVWTSRQLAG